MTDQHSPAAPGDQPRDAAGVPAADATASPEPHPAAGSPAPPLPPRSRKRALLAAGAVGTAGLVAGGVLAMALSASADSGDAAGRGGPGAAGRGVPGYGAPDGAGGPMGGRPGPGAQEEVTGATRDKVVAAVEAKYPDATVERVESGPGDGYHAHVTDDGTMLRVLLDADFVITGAEEGMGGPGGRGPGAGDHDGDGPGVPPAPGATPPAPPASPGATTS